jgi:hypothetical protein
MKRRKKSFNWWIPSLIVLGVLLVGAGYFFGSSIKGAVINVFTTNQIPVNPSSEQISPSFHIYLTVTPSVVCEGNSVTGRISSDMPFAFCGIFYNVNSGGWKWLKNVQLDGGGVYQETQVLNQAGSVVFRVVCSLNDLFKVSNDAGVIVNVCNSPPPQQNDTPQGYSCTDSDGGINVWISGHCEDSYHQLGFPDSCLDTARVKEYSCDVNNICQENTLVCPPGTTCVNGACQKPPCASIVNPNSPQDCSIGYCSSGTCTFVPASLSTPAKCSC